MIIRTGNVPWHLFVGRNEHLRILQVGSGLGFSSFGLSRKYQEVYVCDLSPDNLFKLKEQALLQNISNISYVCGFDQKQIPFKNGSFDAVMIDNGLPVILDEAVLKEIKRVISAKGLLYISVENKYSYKKVLHIWQKSVGNIFSAFKEVIRSRDLSLYGYKKLLKKSGFINTKILSLLPNYSEINGIEDVSQLKFLNTRSTDDSKHKNLKSHIRNTSIFRKYMAHHFGICASLSNSSKSIIDNIINDISAKQGSGRWVQDGSIFQVTHKGTFVFKLINEENGQHIIVKAALNDDTRNQLEKNYQQISLLHKGQSIADGIKELVPKPIMNASCNQYDYYVEELKAGEAALIFAADPGRMDQILENAAMIMLQLHLSTSQYSREAHKSPIEEIEKTVKRMRAIAGPRYQREFDAIGQYIEETIPPANLPWVFQKGDCSANNILVAPNSSLTALIDWDQSSLYGLPMIDQINMVESFKRHTLKKGMGEILTDYLFPNKLSIAEKELLFKYCDKMRISEKMIFPLCIMYWMQHVTAQNDSHDERWMKRNIFHVLEYLSNNL